MGGPLIANQWVVPYNQSISYLPFILSERIPCACPCLVRPARTPVTLLSLYALTVRSHRTPSLCALAARPYSALSLCALLAEPLCCTVPRDVHGCGFACCAGVPPATCRCCSSRLLPAPHALSAPLWLARCAPLRLPRCSRNPSPGRSAVVVRVWPCGTAERRHFADVLLADAPPPWCVRLRACMAVLRRPTLGQVACCGMCCADRRHR